MKLIKSIFIVLMTSSLLFCKPVGSGGGNSGGNDSSFYDTKVGYDEKEFPNLFLDDLRTQNPDSIAEILKNLQVNVDVSGDSSDCTKYKTGVAMKNGVSIGTSVKGGCVYKFTVELLSRKMDSNFKPVTPPEMIVYFKSKEIGGVSRKINKGDPATKLQYQLCPTEAVQAFFKPRANCTAGGGTDVSIDVTFDPPRSIPTQTPR